MSSSKTSPPAAQPQGPHSVDSLLRLELLEEASRTGEIATLAGHVDETALRYPKNDPRRLALELLSLEVAFLERHPRLLFQCLWNSCTWRDSAAAIHFYELPKTARDNPGGGSLNHAGSLLRSLLESWLAFKQRVNPNFLWVRSLRPPEHYLDFDLIALDGVRNGLAHAAFTNDGRRLVTGQWLCDGDTGVPIARLVLPLPAYLEGGPPRSAFALCCDRVLSLSSGVRVWDADTGKLLIEDESRGYWQWYASAIAHDGRRYAVSPAADGSEQIDVCDVDRGTLLSRLDVPDAHCLAFSPNDQLLGVGRLGGLVQLWRVQDGSLEATMPGHARTVSSLAFSSNGRWLVSASMDSLRVWDLVSGAEVASRRLEARDAAAFLSYCTGGPGHTTIDLGPEGALAGLYGWGCFLSFARPLALSCVHRNGLTEFINRHGRAVAWYPTNDQLAPHPGGRVWAGGPHHLRVEGPLGDGSS